MIKTIESVSGNDRVVVRLHEQDGKMGLNKYPGFQLCTIVSMTDINSNGIFLVTYNGREALLEEKAIGKPVNVNGETLHIFRRHNIELIVNLENNNNLKQE